MVAEVLECHGTRSNQHVKPTRLICKFASVHVFTTFVALVGVGVLVVACYLQAEALVACSIHISTTRNYTYECMVLKLSMCNGELYQTIKGFTVP